VAITLGLSASQDVNKRMLDDPRSFTGVEGKKIDPITLETINIGVFAPPEEESPAARHLNRGIRLAIRKANAEGGCKGVSFRIMRRWAKDTWAAGSKEVIRLVYNDNVWAVIAYRDGADHIAQQISVKAYIPVVAPVSATISLTHTAVPWIFRMPPDDRKQAQAMITKIQKNSRIHRIGIVSGTGHDQRTAAREITNELIREEKPPVFHFVVPPDNPDNEDIVQRARRFRPDALILILEKNRLKAQLETFVESGLKLPVYMPWIPGAAPEMFNNDDKAPRFMVFPEQPSPEVNLVYRRFCSEYRKTYGESPTISAAYAYDAAILIIRAIRKNGLSRPAIRRGLEEQTGMQGTSGVIVWDNGGSNTTRAVVKELSCKNENRAGRKASH
jgi:branched-chain amino acid transport system substrate-binding protein